MAPVAPAPVAVHPTMHPTTYPAPDYAVAAALPPLTRGRFPVGRVVGIGVVALALVGGGVVGWQFLGPKGGADSPEEPARQSSTPPCPRTCSACST